MEQRQEHNYLKLEIIRENGLPETPIDIDHQSDGIEVLLRSPHDQLCVTIFKKETKDNFLVHIRQGACVHQFRGKIGRKNATIIVGNAAFFLPGEMHIVLHHWRTWKGEYVYTPRVYKYFIRKTFDIAEKAEENYTIVPTKKTLMADNKKMKQKIGEQEKQIKQQQEEILTQKAIIQQEGINNELGAEIERLSRQYLEMETRKKEKKVQILQMEDDMAALDIEYTNRVKQKAEKDLENEKLEDEISELNKQNKEGKEIIKQTKERIGRRKKEIEELERLLHERNAHAEELAEQMSHPEQIAEEQRELAEQVVQMMNNVKELHQQISQKETEATQLRNQLGELERIHQKTIEKISEEESLQNRLSELSSKNDEDFHAQMERIRRIEGANEDLHNYTGRLEKLIQDQEDTVHTQEAKQWLEKAEKLIEEGEPIIYRIQNENEENQ